MGERRRPTRGELGARPDPMNYGLYCRKCASKYCICDEDKLYADDYWEYEPLPGDHWEEDPWGEPHRESEAPEASESTKKETESSSDGGWVAFGAGVAVAAGVAGAIFGLPAAIGVMGASIAAVVGVAVFGDDESS